MWIIPNKLLYQLHIVSQRRLIVNTKELILKFLDMEWKTRKIKKTTLMIQKLIVFVQKIIIDNKNKSNLSSLYDYQKIALNDLLDNIQIAFKEFTNKVS